MNHYMLTKSAALGPWALALSLAVATLGCGPAAGAGDPCNGLASRCNGNVYQVCQADVFITKEECPGQCTEGFGCGACNPANPTACSGNDVVACNADATLGEVITTCTGGLACSAGQCSDSCTATGTNLIYVVDTDMKLLSFDPAKLDSAVSPFSTVGTLNCPGIGFLATPFSMSVDRSGTAWILYNDGQLFKASIEDASCTAAGVTAIPGFDLFGMGFATDQATGDAETLWLASSPDGGCCGDLGFIRNNTMQGVSQIVANAEMSPELTGTGSGELFAFFPDTGAAFVQQLSKTDGTLLGERFTIGSLGSGVVSAWAFAQWGGKFYIFVSLGDGFGGVFENFVGELDPATGAYDKVEANTPYNIVGAGVSTCAPTGPS